MIDGKEYGGNCYFSENKIYYLSITNKIIKNNIVVGHVFPSNLKSSIKINQLKKGIYFIDYKFQGKNFFQKIVI